MLDLAIVLALVVLNAMAHSVYVRRRQTPKRRRQGQAGPHRGLAYPTHPSPGFADMPEHAMAAATFPDRPNEPRPLSSGDRIRSTAAGATQRKQHDMRPAQ